MSHRVVTGGHEEAKRIGILVERARKALAIGFAVMDAEEVECRCRYPDGQPRYVNSSRKMVHQCGK